MRTAIFAGLVTGIATLWFSLPCALSNIDFIYMCVQAAQTGDMVLPLTSYFPPGYPLLLGILTLTGIDALTAGMALAAFGTALSAGALAYTARRFGLPPVIALGIGLLGITLPDVFQIAFNPHLDALYTGLAMVLIACALRLMDKAPPPIATIVFTLAAASLVTLRYHAVLVVIPVIIAVLINKQAASRKAALIALAATVVVLGWIGWGMFVTYGEFESAAGRQISTGKVYRDVGDEASQVIFLEYDKWLETAPKPDTPMMLEAVASVWPQFLVRRAVIAGFVLFILALVLLRNAPPGSILLALFVLLYTLAVSPTYFTPRASALPELVAVLLAASALGCLFRPGMKSKLNLDPALAGGVVFLLMAAGIGFNLWRETKMMDHWRSKRAAIASVDKAAMELADGQSDEILGAMDFTGWIFGGKYNLPGPSYTRYWLDDPQVAPRIDPWIERIRIADFDTAAPPASVVVLWHTGTRVFEGSFAQRLSSDPRWQLADSPISGVQIWQRD